MRWTGAGARRELLRRVLETYEESPSFWAAGPWAEDVVVRLEPQTVPEAFAARGQTLRTAFAEGAEALAREGVVRLVRARGPGGGAPRALRLGSAEVATAMVAAGQEGFARLGEVLEEFADRVLALGMEAGLPGWMASFLRRVGSRAAEADLQPLGMTRTAFKHARAEVLDALRAAALLSQGEGAPERALSERLFGDPERLGALRTQVADVLRRADPRWEGRGALEPGEVLAAYGVQAAPRRPRTVRGRRARARRAGGGRPMRR